MEKLGGRGPRAGDSFGLVFFIHGGTGYGLETNFHRDEGLELAVTPIAGIHHIIVKLHIEPSESAWSATRRGPINKLGFKRFSLAMEVAPGAGESLDLAGRVDRPCGQNHRQHSDGCNGSHHDDKKVLAHGRIPKETSVVVEHFSTNRDPSSVRSGRGWSKCELLAPFFSRRSASPRTLQMPTARPTRPGPLGAHQSISGGYAKAVERAVETGCEALQIFTRNINQWQTKPITNGEADAFREAVAEAKLAFVVAHDSYLINPATADSVLRKKSITSLAEEIERAERLGIGWVVAHPGAAGEQPRDRAVERAAAGIAESLLSTADLRAGILIETTAGQGTCLGDSFEEIGAMLAGIDAVPGLRKRVNVCLDTCHVFAAGYPLFPAKALDATLDAFDDLIGLERLVCIHANDSKRELGSHVDRHEAIGKGEIGREAFRLIVNHPRLAGIPLILETPKEGPDGKPTPTRDRANLAVLRRLRTSNR